MKKLLLFCSIMLTVLAAVGGWFYWWWFNAPSTQIANIQYGERDGKPLLLDVFQPPEPNGAAVILCVSGSWKSSEGSIQPFLFAPFVRRGYTVFAVRHISQPECLIGDIVDDIRRSVRFIRHHADEYRVDGDRLGIIGGSSGGHLSLMIGTTGGSGDPLATDPIDRESSAVQCVACFYPPTDLLNLGDSTENPGDGGPPKSFRKGFGPRAENMADWKILGKELSPIYHISDKMPPTFIVHGSADTLVPLDQSQRFLEAATEKGRTVVLEVRPGKPHGWPTMIFDIVRFADWFDEHLVSTASANN